MGCGGRRYRLLLPLRIPRLIFIHVIITLVSALGNHVIKYMQSRQLGNGGKMGTKVTWASLPYRRLRAKLVLKVKFPEGLCLVKEKR